MPHGDYSAYLWAKNQGTLVAFETFLRRHPESAYAMFFRDEIRRRFVPQEENWQEAWRTYSKMEIIKGAYIEPGGGFVLIGAAGSGRLPPLFYEDMMVAIQCSLDEEKVGVTMTRIFPAGSDRPEDFASFPHESFETSVDFYSPKLRNAHLGYVIFEGDRMLKSLSDGFDIFHDEEIRSNIPGFQTVREMAAAEPLATGQSGANGLSDYGRVWIELLNVQLSTTEQNNAAMFSDVKMEVRAESRYDPLIRFANHLQTHYAEFTVEYPIFGEVERAARVVSIARWMAKNYPDESRKLVNDFYDPVRVELPQKIEAKYFQTHVVRGVGEAGLVGGVTFPNVNKYKNDPDARMAETRLLDLPKAVQAAKPNSQSLAWQAELGKQVEQRVIAWRITSRPAPAKPIHSANLNNGDPSIARR
jgi:hypothetical protein